ncbi:hypothetical protein [Mycobacterium sp. pW045]|uniref:hypothetical protein n=1 Tax=Mycobacterium sp. pW045 TaxID=3238984 RepID=UPI00351BAD45
MMRAAKQRNQLGQLTKVGQGGQGVVYRTSAARTSFTDAMVYKEYKSDTRTDVDFTALAAMPTLVEQSMPRQEGERLISIAAWPCELVEDDGVPTGFLMPEIPDAFTVSLTTLKGVSDGLAEFQHLLNPQAVLDARGIVIDEVQRYELLREVASAMAFLHRHAVCIGDMSPKNLLFSLKPRAAVYFVDCDGMRIDGMSVLPQMETPGWAVPTGEELATVYSDAYKLGLLALRLIVGSQITTRPDDLPTDTPTMLHQIIADTLCHEPERRPLPAAWTYILNNAIEEAQHRKNTPLPAPTSPAPVPSTSTAPQPAPPSRSVDSTWASVAKWAAVLTGASLVAILLVSVLSAVVGNFGSPSSSSSTPSTTRAHRTTGPSNSPNYSSPTSSPPTYSSSTSPPAAQEPRQMALPPLVSGPDGSSQRQTCDGGYQMNSRTGWGTRSGRGTLETSCRFAQQVLEAYWATYGNVSPERRTVVAAGSVPCRSTSGAECSGSRFVVHCVAYASNWITCRGGNNAVVYLY